MIYIYADHLGGELYYTEDEKDLRDLYCETCGDADQLIGKASTRKEAYALFAGEININGSGGWEKEYIDDFISGIDFSEEV